MEHVRIAGKTRTLGMDQGYQPLHVRDELDSSGDFNVMWMAWKPSPEDLAILNAGGNVEIGMMGTVPPPVKARVGECGGS